MSIDITIDNAVKRYGDTTVIPGLSVEIKAGEFFTLLGPSGCGKTTLLRMIAGFNSIESGDLCFNGVRINDLEPAKRKIGMVFQNYAIFPHLTVRKNVEFGLRNSSYPRDRIRDRAQEFMDLVQIGHLADRMPEQLSGGQQQRVALARALCPEPDVLLMDEPLSNLDAKLRIDMRTAIKEIQRSVGTTTVYVTHDQEEAMAVSDRIAVMSDGVIQHLGTPPELYHRPANTFVSQFVGRSNSLPGKLSVSERSTVVSVAGLEVDVPGLKVAPVTSQAVVVSVRPEEFVINAAGAEGIPGVIEDTMFLGLNVHHRIKLQDGTHVEVIEESDFTTLHQPGTRVALTVKAQKINVFTADGSVNLLRENPDSAAGTPLATAVEL